MSGIGPNLAHGMVAVVLAALCHAVEAQPVAISPSLAQTPMEVRDTAGTASTTDISLSQPDEHAQAEPSLPTDAISSAANPPDDGPAADAAPSSVPAPLPPAPDIAVTDSRLLSIQIDADGVQTVAPATAVPYVVGRSCYSWEIHYAPAEGDLTLSEELVLPGPARNWDATPADRTKVNPQGTGAITERHFDAATGTASAGWCVAASDPVGAYRYIVRQGDREVARFDFSVGDLL